MTGDLASLQLAALRTCEGSGQSAVTLAESRGFTVLGRGSSRVGIEGEADTVAKVAYTACGLALNLHEAAVWLAAVSAGNSANEVSVQQISAQLPVYTGLIETARTYTPARLPILTIHAPADVDETNSRPADRSFLLPIRVFRQDTGGFAPVRTIKVDYSLQDGKTWQPVPFTAPGPGVRFTALTASGGGFTAAARFGSSSGTTAAAVWTSANGTSWTRSSVSGLTDGYYLIGVTMGDGSYPHDAMRVLANGLLLLDNLTNGPGQFLDRTLVVKSSGGIIDLTFSDQGGFDPYWVVNAIEIRPAKILTLGLQAPPGPIVSDGQTPPSPPDTVLGFGADPGALITVATTIGSSRSISSAIS